MSASVSARETTWLFLAMHSGPRSRNQITHIVYHKMRTRAPKLL